MQNNLLKSLARFTALVFGVLMLAACQDSALSDLERFVATAFQDKKPDIEPLPEIPPYSEFEYASADENDPFSVTNIVTSAPANAQLGQRPDTSRRREELERFPLEALRMVGTLVQAKTPYVIVQTNEGTAHRARVGNYIGMDEGKITSISPDEQRVVITELVLDPAGRWVTREVDITINE